MQKALLQMNIQLSQALSDVTGDTGQRIIRAMVAGERDPHTLAALRNYRCKKDVNEIALALTGTWREEHLFVLKQALALFDFYTAQLSECDAQIERAFSVIKPRFEPAPAPRCQQFVAAPIDSRYMAKSSASCCCEEFPRERAVQQAYRSSLRIAASTSVACARRRAW